MSKNSPRRICVGKILGAHGVRGLAKIASFTAEPESVAAYGPVSDETGKRRWTLTLQSWNKDHFLARLSGVDTREQAQALRGTSLYVPRTALPAATGDSFYYADLIGLEARLDTGAVYGAVVAVTNYGASDILDIRRPDGTSVLLPFANAFVPDVHLADGWLRIIPPEIVEPNESPPRE